MYCLGYFYSANWKMKGFNLGIASQEGFRICDHHGIRHTGIQQCLRDYMQIHSQEKIDVRSGDPVHSAIPSPTRSHCIIHAK